MTLNITWVYPTKNTVPVVSSTITTSIPNGLFMTPGVFDWSGTKFDTTGGEGLICLFGYPVGGGGYRILVGSTPDPYNIMASMFQNIGLGEAHISLTPAQLLVQMRYGTVFLTCGYVSYLMQYALGLHGFATRRVLVQTASTINGYDDGHVIFEVMIGGKWRLVDVMGNYFTKDGDHLSLAEVIEYGVENCDLVVMATRKVAPANLWVSGQNIFPHTSFFEQYLSTDAKYIAWASRIYNVPGIVHTDGYVYCYRPTGTSGATLDPSWRVDTKAAWLSRLYP